MRSWKICYAVRDSANEYFEKVWVTDADTVSDALVAGNEFVHNLKNMFDYRAVMITDIMLMGDPDKPVI